MRYDNDARKIISGSSTTRAEAQQIRLETQLHDPRLGWAIHTLADRYSNLNIDQHRSWLTETLWQQRSASLPECERPVRLQEALKLNDEQQATAKSVERTIVIGRLDTVAVELEAQTPPPKPPYSDIRRELSTMPAAVLCKPIRFGFINTDLCGTNWDTIFRPIV